MSDDGILADTHEVQFGEFGRLFLEKYLTFGFASLSKKDIELLLYYSLEHVGIIDRDSRNHVVARGLHITESRVSTLRREAYARWADGEERARLLRKALTGYFGGDNIEGVLESADPAKLADGFLPILLEHPVQREEFVAGLKDLHLIPTYARNREVLLVKLGGLLALLEHTGLVKPSAAMLKRLRTTLGKHTTLPDLLKKDLRDIDSDEVREAFNEAAAGALADAVSSGAGGTLIAAIGKVLGF